MGIEVGCVCVLNDPAIKCYKPSLQDCDSGFLSLQKRELEVKVKWRTHELTPDLCGKKEAPNIDLYTHNGFCSDTYVAASSYVSLPQ